MPKKTSTTVVATTTPATEATEVPLVEEVVPDKHETADASPVTFVLGGMEISDEDVGDADELETELETGEEFDDEDDAPFEQVDELADAMMHVAEQLSTDDGESFSNVLEGIRQQVVSQNALLEKQVKILYKIYSAFNARNE